MKLEPMTCCKCGEPGSNNMCNSCINDLYNDLRNLGKAYELVSGELRDLKSEHEILKNNYDRLVDISMGYSK